MQRNFNSIKIWTTQKDAFLLEKWKIYIWEQLLFSKNMQKQNELVLLAAQQSNSKMTKFLIN